jgi:UDP-2-acetamido-2,6-beta-L-arabino-hexul-4-ose reductase
MRTVLITGSEGFIGGNLRLRLTERVDVEIIGVGRAQGEAELAEAASKADFVFHLAGVNRPKDASEFETGNPGYTAALCAALAATGNGAPVAYASSTQAEADNPYGRSKNAAEEELMRHGERTGAPAIIYRLPNVFGKWARPNYNSAVATFCQNIAHGEEIRIDRPAAPLRLVYIDDVIDEFLRLLDEDQHSSGRREVAPVYETTVGAVAEIIHSFPASRETLLMPRVGTGLMRALYSTYLSYLDPDSFAYDVPVHADPRGTFVEMLKTEDSGQFSYLTAGPGVTRGEHYHHSKAEKFLVIAGTARFGFRHVVSNDRHQLVVRGGEGRIVETIPGWTHDITNAGKDQLVVMLWANEIFDRARPDTIPMRV